MPVSSITSTNSSDLEYNQLTAKVNFYESCVDQLTKELPKYLLYHTDINKPAKALTKVFKTVASSEPNQQLQKSLFLYAQKYDLLEDERKVYSRCRDQNLSMLTEAKQLLILPIKEVLTDVTSMRKKRAKIQLKIEQKIENDRKLQFQNNSSNGSLPTPPIFPLTQSDIELSLPLHSQLFEKHRIKSMKNVISNLLYSELRYHCKVVEELSQVLQTLEEVEME